MSFYNNLAKSNGENIALLPTLSVTAALTGTYPGRGGSAGVQVGTGVKNISAFAVFDYGSGGTTAKAWIQTSFDKGVTWIDIINFAFTTADLNKVAAVSANIAATHATPTDAALADNTINNGLIGDRIRLKVTTTGIYAATTLKIDVTTKG